jgi:DNA-binding NarL/FixJ family response regulator
MLEYKAVNKARVEGPPQNRRVILFIDQQALTRDCIGIELARVLPEFSVLSRAAAHEIVPNPVPGTIGAIVLAVHDDGIGVPGNGRESVPDGTATQLSILERIAPGVPRMLVSDRELPGQVLDALLTRVRGYVPTSMPIAQTAHAIRLVAAGNVFLPDGFLPAHRSDPDETRPRESDSLAPSALFTPRQNEVLSLLCDGYSNKLIAYHLGMSEATVKVHVRAMMKKLKVTNRTQVVLRTRGRGQQPAIALSDHL